MEIYSSYDYHAVIFEFCRHFYKILHILNKFKLLLTSTDCLWKDLKIPLPAFSLSSPEIFSAVSSAIGASHVLMIAREPGAAAEACLLWVSRVWPWDFSLIQAFWREDLFPPVRIQILYFLSSLTGFLLYSLPPTPTLILSFLNSVSQIKSNWKIIATGFFEQKQPPGHILQSQRSSHPHKQSRETGCR